MDSVSVLIVDDQDSFRAATRALVASTPGFEPSGEAASGEEALEAALALQPDLILVDLAMPGLDGLETSRRLHAALPAAIVVVTSADDAPVPSESSASYGAAAFLPKEALTRGALRALWEEHGASRGG